jgi:tetratricopeptide (TPR) repeat protein
VLGLPAAAAAGAAIAILGLNPKADQIKLRSRYRTEAEQALAARQWNDAHIRYQRLASDSGYLPNDVYGLALALEGEGRHAEAESLFHRLAPDEITGQPEAHVRRAVELLGQTPPDILRAEGQLFRALHAKPDYAEAHALLGQLRLTAGNADDAIKHLTIAVRSHPDLSLSLATIYVGRDATASRSWATKAVDHFGPASTAHPDDAQLRYRHALALRLAHRYRKSADVIRQGLARGEDPRLRLLAGDVYAAWCATLTGESRTAERLRRIEEGLDLDPAAGPLLKGLAEVAGGNGPVAAAARASADRRMAGGGTIAVGLKLAFGIEAQKRGDIVWARRLLGEAHQADPASPIVAKNLAWLLIREPSPEPERALEIINVALKNRIEDPILRDMRGQILVRLGRWQEATHDLEYAVPLLPPNRETHRALARAYRGLNLNSLAEAQDRKANELGKSGD